MSQRSCECAAAGDIRGAVPHVAALMRAIGWSGISGSKTPSVVPAVAGTTRGRWRAKSYDAALCSPNARASRASTGATVSIRRAAARSTVSPAVSTTAAARA